MRSVRPIYARNSTSISELKKNPMAVVEESHGEPVAVLNRNQPAFYCIPAATYEALMEELEDRDLLELVKKRQHEDEVEVNIDDL
ncbi:MULTISPECIES: type II toxin-antitoxin system Phd/YefM family antitoxin [Idiomarina]|jgi:antitoxin StbD|uniref:Antitoxin n=2 Tax=Idiomarina TaxID=135575 RepID=A0A8I1GA70_9GAMM|nr:MULTISPECIES: type II toxin-antitoxin system Phd/YefM family antitoxin [Idiomarina]KPD20451.1 antitoxin [Idiomarina abyssalis]MAO67458.1 type II toxin-antitoxin system Phd/YefM family antitoxin [Idiomarina sp.]MBE92995.1 type II toxin-antitoxin system Phd/YefM family antitoxin [Idiomarina sp.]MBF80360.1 type II toxin-antitoxin system Phd/YefM family antitoxin [Idiomarina sp.]MBH94405.1 type II toxin-antitoxin system Phd/YefM family antitoxin [Idiomarina sp.]|tara:strand:+ start:104 stop:358 length:255 start_codon:yes stop_codon:yes gene_type:complete